MIVKNNLVDGVKGSSKVLVCLRRGLVFGDVRPIRHHQFIGFTAKELQTGLEREAREVFKDFVIGNYFGVVATAI